MVYTPLIHLMKRTNIYLTDEQHDWLSRTSQELNVPSAEIVRRAVDYWIKVKSHPFEKLAEAQDPDYDPLTAHTQLKPFGVDLIDRLERIEYLLWHAVSAETRLEVQQKAEEYARLWGFLPSDPSDE
jgi:hypothetical protein